MHVTLFKSYHLNTYKSCDADVEKSSLPLSLLNAVHQILVSRTLNPAGAQVINLVHTPKQLPQTTIQYCDLWDSMHQYTRSLEVSKQLHKIVLCVTNSGCIFFQNSVVYGTYSTNIFFEFYKPINLKCRCKLFLLRHLSTFSDIFMYLQYLYQNTQSYIRHLFMK